jgi:DNA helicase-2/ATP-dependent DNA helicase PcrA
MEWSNFQKNIFAAVVSTDDNLAINAVAGSGKTTTIVEAARLLTGDVAFLAFNKHIVGELQKRLPSNVQAMTIHSLGYKTLASRRKRLNVSEYKYADIIDAALASSILGRSATFKRAVSRLVDMARLTLTNLSDRNATGELISHHAISAQIAEAVEELTEADGSDWSYGQVYDRVVKLASAAIDPIGVNECRDAGKIDFTDMLYMPVRLGIRPPQFDTVLVDEAQDLSAAQLALVRQAGRRIIAVGDPQQAIQGFAGADNRAFATLVEQTGAVELPLSVCYRCPTSHLELAQGIVPHIQPRDDAPVGRVLKITREQFASMPHAGDLIICRRNAPLVGSALKLIASGIQARIRGRNIGEGLVKLAQDADKIKLAQDLPWRVGFLQRLQRHHGNRRGMLEQKPHSESALQALDDSVDCIEAFFSGRPEIESMSDFKNQLAALFADAGASVWLSSIHRAKGLEADRVFVLDPDKMALSYPGMRPWQAEQEQNLRYVGLTRAKSDLYFVQE